MPAKTMLFAKYALITAYLAADYVALAARYQSLDSMLHVLIFLVLYAIFAALLYVTALISNTPFRLIVALVFAAASILLQTYERGTHQPLTYSIFVTLITSHGDLGTALYQYGDVLKVTVPLGIVLFLGIALPPKVSRPYARVASLAPVVGVALLSGILFFRGGEGAAALPAPYAPVAFTVLDAQQRLTAVSLPDVTLPRDDNRKLDRDIVLIVDESIAPQFLDINNANGVPSGLAHPPAGIDVVNFGYAAAIHNCSAGSNTTLRYGGTRENYQEMREGRTNIWAYAKQAGLRTVYLDGQRDHGELQNAMTETEKAQIDDFVQLDDEPIRDRDQKLAELLAERIGNGHPEFIYINKVGGHFPVHDRFPESAAKYFPILPRGHYAERSDGGAEPVIGFDGSVEAWRRYRNSYRNTLLWNVGGFFDHLMAKADLEKATIIYTSDHGQDLQPRSGRTLATHCGSRPRLDEGVVPLVVIDSASAPLLDWRQNLEINRNASSAYNIFPTLVAMMGYKRGPIHAHYGRALDERTNDPFTFNLNYYVFLGREPYWQKVNLDKLALPDNADFEG